MKVRFLFIPNREGCIDEFICNIYGRFPPKARFNMDQVPLPFVVSQDRTFTTDTDEHVHIRTCGADGLDKRQFTMHITSNAGEGNDSFFTIDMIARGTGTRISAVEREGWNENIGVFFQKCAWVDRPTMLRLAKRFCEKKEKKFGTKWVLMFCDNLDAHCWEEVLACFASHHVFVVFFVANCTDGLQPIDAGIGRSVRINVGHELDAWLMEGDNLDKWEAGFKAKERRVLMTNFLASAAMKAEQDDQLRRGCFERTGCLIRLDPSPEHDAKIKPQGLRLPYVIPNAIPDHLRPRNSQFQVETPSVRLDASSIEANQEDEINEDGDVGDLIENIANSSMAAKVIDHVSEFWNDWATEDKGEEKLQYLTSLFSVMERRLWSEIDSGRYNII